ncbi:MAG: T9SS type A sorting domain-containing protein [Flavobacteriia bacterium]|nr:T9SS type A sorting domain-containing protein [Flavobacteriia bacterium]
MKNQILLFKSIFFGVFCVIASHSFAQTISAGGEHSMSICTDGTVLAWGNNWHGQLGDGTNIDRSTPIVVSDLTMVVAITRGLDHTIALKNDGTVWAWGYNSQGQLGNGTTNQSNTPVQVINLTGVVAIAGALNHTIVLKNDGTVWSWGYNWYGQLGDGTNINSATPVQVNNLTGVIAIAGGDDHSLALKDDGTIWAWGHNWYGQLGDGTYIDRNTPVQVSNLIGVIAIAGGDKHTVALKNDGTVWSWGSDDFGQIGDGLNNWGSNIPLLVSNLTEIIAVTAGSNHTLALKNDGTVWSWGFNAYGQLGDGTNTNRNIPVQISNLTGITAISGGGYHTIALKDEATLWSCGRNSRGQLGDGTNTDRNIPVQTIQLCEVQQPTGIKGIKGYMFLDFNENCVKDIGEQGIPNRHLLITQGNIVLQTNNSGFWYLDSLPAGNYTITIDTSNTNWTPTCPITQSFTVVHPDSLTIAPSFGMVANNPCPAPTISVNMPFMRPCFTNQQIFVQACNEYDATGILPNAYSIVELDPNLIFENASLPYTNLGNNQYRFQHDTLYPGECVNYTISTQVNCDAPLGLTLCLETNLYPVADCVLDTIPTPPSGEIMPCTLPWDHSSLSVEGWCANDSIYFTITNSGELDGGDMECYSPVRIYIDGVPYLLDSIKLLGEETYTYVFLGTGQTWILEADQHPLHPGNSHPNAHVENCNPGNWTPELVNVFPQDDADPVKDIYCGVVTGSYDPNDKKGTPYGLGTEHEVLPNQDIEYLIRFQNTGTDTAFNIVVRDTLDLDFDIFSVIPGSASHDYNFRMYGPRVMEWTFPNILLPDSTTNEVASHGFLSYRVKQKPNLPNGTLLSNDADIYFDFNEPIITNETSHKVQRRTFEPTNSLTQLSKTKTGIKVYPNPTKQETTLSFSTYQKQISYNLLNISGQIVLEKANLYGKEIKVNLSDVPNGLYFMEVKTDLGTEMVKVVKE